MTAPEGGWQRLARCQAQYAAYFFPPVDGELPHDRQAREAVARAVCRSCPVQRPCLEAALELKEPHGVWGGMNERERRSVRRRRALAPA